MQEKGSISGRLFEPCKAGGKILKLAYELWNNAHTATLEDYGLKEEFGVLFHLSIED